MGVTALIFGIISIVLSFLSGLGIPGIVVFVLGPAGIVLGALGMKTPQKTIATAGLVLSIVALVIGGILFATCGCAVINACNEVVEQLNQLP